MSYHPPIRLALILCLLAGVTADDTNRTIIPAARKSDQVDDYHGTKVADPYRWLEDLDSAETRSGSKRKTSSRFGYLDEHSQRANTLKDRLTKLWNYEKYGVPFKEGNRYFYTRNSGLQNQAVLYTVTALDAATAR